MKIPKISKLDYPNILGMATAFVSFGKLAISSNNLVYLDVDDGYIHQLFPLLLDQGIQKPNYFGEGKVGAHVTAIYPDENKKINKVDLGQEHRFVIKDIVTAEIDVKIYYVLLVESSSLLQLRRKYNLPDILCFRGYSIGFHITIGVLNRV